MILILLNMHTIDNWSFHWKKKQCAFFFNLQIRHKNLFTSKHMDSLLTDSDNWIALFEKTATIYIDEYA